MPKKLRTEKGQSLVEISLILPILILLFLGVAEVGLITFAHVQVSNAARAGARYGTLCRLNDNCDGGSSYSNLSGVVTGAVFSESQVIKLIGVNTVVNVQPASLSIVPQVGLPLTVTVTYSHTPPILSELIPMVPSEIPIKHTVVMHFDK
jgi:Flp pilus assembly protein TadG